MKKRKVTMILLLYFSSLILSSTTTCAQQQRSTITPDEPMNSTGYLVSPAGNFRLGFFTPGRSKSRYLGLWYNNIAVQTVVWVANRGNPIPPDSSSMDSRRGGALLRLDKNGTLLLTNNDGTVLYWYSNGNSSSSPTGDTTRITNGPLIAQLDDTGNLQVVGGAGSNGILWQSFDYPSDTLLPGMKMGVDLGTGLDRRITAWKSFEDPAPGDVSMGMDTRGVPQIIVSRRMLWDTGAWELNLFGSVCFFLNTTVEVYVQCTSRTDVVVCLVLTSFGVLQQLAWSEQVKSWFLFQATPSDYGPCKAANGCGPYSVCSANNSPTCSCLLGFRPQTSYASNFSNRSAKCVRTAPTDCSNGTDGFQVVRVTELPDTSKATVVGATELADCRVECLRKCSCTAYATADIYKFLTRGTSDDCIIWTSELIDLTVYDSGGQNLYVRIAAKDVGTTALCTTAAT